MTWPPFGNCVNCVMKALHNFIAWSFLFEIVMRFSSPSLLKKIVTFLEKSLQKCTRKKPMIWSKNTQISIPPPTSKGTITAAQVGWIGVWVFLRYFSWRVQSMDDNERTTRHLTKNPWAFWVVFLIFQRGGAAVRICPRRGQVETSSNRWSAGLHQILDMWSTSWLDRLFYYQKGGLCYTTTNRQYLVGWWRCLSHWMVAPTFYR